MATKRTGLGRGIGALIPTSSSTERPVDVFFPGKPRDPNEPGLTELLERAKPFL